MTPSGRPRRHASRFDPKALVPAGVKGAAGTIDDQLVAALVGKLVANFVHLEDQLAMILAELSGTDFATAGYMLRALTSPTARVRLMRELLQKSPRNRDRATEWDKALNEFERVSRARNEYVHGHWWTSHDDGSVWLAKSDEHGASAFAAIPLDIAEIEKLLLDMGHLLVAIPFLVVRPEAG